MSGTEFLGLSGTTNTTVEFAEGNTLLVFLDVVKVSISFAQLHTLNGSSDFVSVLELKWKIAQFSFAISFLLKIFLTYMNTKVRTSRLGGYNCKKKKVLILYSQSFS